MQLVIKIVLLVMEILIVNVTHVIQDLSNINNLLVYLNVPLDMLA